MYFIDKDKIDAYRFAVAKVCFIELYQSRYKLLENIDNSNCMIVQDIDLNGKILISLFSKPTIRTNDFSRVICYYQKLHYYRVRKKYDNSIITDNNVSILEFSEEFDKQYNLSFEQAIKYPEKYINNIRMEYRFLFETILITRKDVSKYNNKRYKYYSKTKIEENNYNENEGAVYFSDPNTFNDPFDVNCFFANDDDISNLFRILCVAPTPREILMWSYYSSDHKGYCFEYEERDILEAILNINMDGICIIGKVDYSDSRPAQKSQINAISITEIDFYIRAAFTKYREWAHEKEYRYVILSEDLDKKEQYYKITIPVNDIYCGCKAESEFVKDSTGEIVMHAIKMNKSIDKYEIT